jgi:hypothetical protein
MPIIEMHIEDTRSLASPSIIEGVRQPSFQCSQCLGPRHSPPIGAMAGHAWLGIARVVSALVWISIPVCMYGSRHRSFCSQGRSNVIIYFGPQQLICWVYWSFDTLLSFCHDFVPEMNRIIRGETVLISMLPSSSGRSVSWA